MLESFLLVISISIGYLCAYYVLISLITGSEKDQTTAPYNDIYSRYVCLKGKIKLVFTVSYSNILTSIFIFAGELHVKKLQKEVQDCYTRICDLSSKLKQQDNDIFILKEELNKLLTELAETRVTLKDIVDKINYNFIA